MGFFNPYFKFLEKTEVFLEVFGNAEIRSQAEEVLQRVASQLSLSVTETMATHACLNTTLLKVQTSAEGAYFYLNSQTLQLAQYNL